ncbi:MAG TPA: NADH-quinone oxidoreductase subunit NuoE [Candidatus Syntrophosphaera sp.]|jgi:NADH:ubiquinone oxidoreductase subunit E|nr:NADH-quinone oxidoreductase subunit NuoE [Candidatus Cloacimonadota bacterium]HNU54164.1 NADH-quinone oxidoreductase subunit NuoE [Candidatus Syntrophosphaera sp.]HOH47762.1 NADH-quinone oxidoreductase subunit NuoE [Candidatus Syntrophosphaera sp.]HPW38105.1 NADH-quinone oxidoreductase subunit NuoE [Candidatus Syntrophosphaera sp.]HQC47394.1 NADH-quinone oxidoreductase subunit NuoE [Candidatus Syntrophosphaera sp.]
MEQDFSRLDALLQEYEGRKGSLIPFLQAAQELEGYLSRPALKYISERMKVPAAEICGVVTFYSMFRLEPQGKHIIRVCKGTACYVSEADGIKDALIENLKLEDGKLTTDDMLFTLMEVSCLGCCSLAPVIMIDNKTFGKLTPEAIPGILEKFRNGEA